MNLKAIRRTFLIVCLALNMSQHASAAPAVEEYAQQAMDNGVAILKDGSLSSSERTARLGAFLRSTMDIRRIALFTLGPTAPGASPSDIESYVQAFENLTLAKYESMIDGYGGQSLKVTGSKENGPGDFILTAIVIDPTARSNDNSTTVLFRVIEEGPKFALVDASVEGVWFEIAERDSVQAFLAQNGKSVPKLIEHIRQMTAKLSASQ